MRGVSPAAEKVLTGGFKIEIVDINQIFAPAVSQQNIDFHVHRLLAVSKAIRFLRPVFRSVSGAQPVTFLSSVISAALAS